VLRVCYGCYGCVRGVYGVCTTTSYLKSADGLRARRNRTKARPQTALMQVAPTAEAIKTTFSLRPLTHVPCAIAGPPRRPGGRASGPWALAARADRRPSRCRSRCSSQRTPTSVQTCFYLALTPPGAQNRQPRTPHACMCVNIHQQTKADLNINTRCRRVEAHQPEGRSTPLPLQEK